MIKFLLKNKGMTISGVKNLINSNINQLDDNNLHGLKAHYYKDTLKSKSKLLLKKIEEIKNYGKKTHLKVRMVLEVILIVNSFTMPRNQLKAKKRKTN